MKKILLLCVGLLVACGSSADEQASGTVVSSSAGELTLHTIDWNAAKTNVGGVATIVEDDEELVLFGDKGATMMAGGAVRSVITGPKAWSDAATIPAADGIGDWTVGISSDGKILRVHGEELEDVGARWGLASDKVRTLMGIDKLGVAFGYEGGLAIADGTKVTRYDGPTSGALAGGSGKLVWIDGDVKVFTLADRKVRAYPIPGANAIAVDGKGNLVVSADRTLWRERADGLAKRWTADAPIGNLSPANGRVWMTIGTELALLADDDLSISKGANLPADAKLRGTAKGDVWVLSSSGVRKYGGSAPTEVLVDWQTNMQPIYATVCSGCHAPGGTAGSDLSTLAGWKQHRAAIEQRVVVDKTMPPKGTAFTDDQRAAVKAWLSRN